ncbi:MAG: DNA replication/repair protein RecF [Anaerolineae bacterium]|jgi:DNA replication and repair protein RecF|nr:DNA replication/repair protein RecF [Anaerolineae bacterium]
MHIQHLSLTNFRNYARLELSLTAGQPVVLHGDNAQGKTSLLEAIYYLATSRSPYTSSDRQLIHWRTEHDPLPFARLTADLGGRRGGVQHLEVTLLLDHSSGTPRFKKTLKLNGVEKRVMDVVGLLPVVLFLPQDLILVEGSPADRRRYMDNTLIQGVSSYLEALEQYEKVLPQRNALLRRIAERRAGRQELPYWDEQLTLAGAVLIAGRQMFLRELERLAQRTHDALTGSRETLTLHYQPAFTPTAGGSGQRSFNVPGLDLHRELTAAQIQPQLYAQLQAEQSESIERGATLSGPHRDELRLFINGRDCGLYGSRGQARTTVLALKLAELDWLAQRCGEPPVLLLDEVVAELDSARRAFLLARLDGSAQTLVTTTELDIFTRDFLQRAQLLRIINGQIAPAG